MPNSMLKSLTISMRKRELQPSFLILKHTFLVAHSFLKTFTDLRVGKTGPTTDKEQDLLRAMLTFSASGLDSMVKQLIRDCLENVINLNPGTHIEFEKFVSRKLRQKVSQDGVEVLDIKYISKILISDSPKKELILQYIEELTAGSLQSGDSILKVGACFDIASSKISSNYDKLKDAFDVRNLIAHEMDINFNQQSRKTRYQRKRAEMMRHTNTLLETAENFISCVNSKI